MATVVLSFRFLRALRGERALVEVPSGSGVWLVVEETTPHPRCGDHAPVEVIAHATWSAKWSRDGSRRRCEPVGPVVGVRHRPSLGRIRAASQGDHLDDESIDVLDARPDLHRCPRRLPRRLEGLRAGPGDREPSRPGVGGHDDQPTAAGRESKPVGRPGAWDDRARYLHLAPEDRVDLSVHGDSGGLRLQHVGAPLREDRQAGAGK